MTFLCFLVLTRIETGLNTILGRGDGGSHTNRLGHSDSGLASLGSLVGQGLDEGASGLAQVVRNLN